MTDRSDVARGRSVVERWCVLAEQRLDYLTELYESGRWRRFHTEMDFLNNVQEAKRAVTTWRALLDKQALPDNRPISLSWLTSEAPLAPRHPALFANERSAAQPRSIDIPAKDAPPVVPVDSRPAQAAVAAKPEPRGWEAIDLSLMQQRYPLLRTSL